MATWWPAVSAKLHGLYIVVGVCNNLVSKNVTIKSTFLFMNEIRVSMCNLIHSFSKGH